MKKKSTEPQIPGFALPHPSSKDLRGKQSVRATFRLSPRAIEAISIVAAQLGIKQKSLFDHLIEDAETLTLIAREVQAVHLTQMPRIQKTYVLSRRTLRNLERTSKEYDAPRDALVEFSIQRLFPIIARERDRHRKRKLIAAETGVFLQEGKTLLHRIARALGEDDTLTVQFESALKALVNAQNQIDETIARGETIEAFLR